MLEKIQKYIRADYFEIFENKRRISLQENEIGGYEYSVVLPYNCSLALHLRMDCFINAQNIPYVKMKGCMDCDDIIIDETNKTVYIMEVKDRTAFRSCLAAEFELKEQHTKLFLEYFFMLCDCFEKLNDYKINYIRWCYANCKPSATRKGMDDFYFQYRRADEKVVYKINKIDKIFLDKLYLVSNYI